MAPLRVLDLFSGSQSIGRWAEEHHPGTFTVTSLDNTVFHGTVRPTILCDVLEWDFRALRPGSFDIIHASPPCTEYSIAKTVGVRDLDLADRLVKRTFEIIDYFKPRLWYIENPWTGQLKNRDFMLLRPVQVVSYCSYGKGYKKDTGLWTNSQVFQGKRCAGPYACPQRVPGKPYHRNTVRGRPKSDQKSINGSFYLSSLPPALLDAMFAEALDW